MKTITKHKGNYTVSMGINNDFGDLLNSIDKDLLDGEGLSKDKLDIIQRFFDYSHIDNSIFSIEGNSNASGAKNYSNRQAEVYKSFDKLISYYALWSQLKNDFGLEIANETIKESIEGSFMIHDLTNGGVGIDFIYCTTLLCKNIMLYGRPYNSLYSKAPKYADSFIGQVIEYIIDASNIYAGAQALPDFFISYAYYTKKENLSEDTIRQHLQRFVHIVNNPYRPSYQSPFSNLTLLTESGIISSFGAYEYPDGTFAIDNIDEILRIQKIFAEYFGKGIEQEDGIYRVATFPVVTLNIVRDSIKDDYEYIKDILKCFNKFMNLNIYVGSADKFASCCRLINNVNKANAINSFGAGAVGEATVGSCRVVSYNLMDMAIETMQKYNDPEKYFDVLNEKMEIGLYALKSQRKLAKKRLEEGFNTFYNLGWIKLEDYFSTYGAGGLFEACKVLFNGNLNEDYTEQELEFAKRIPKFMEDFAESHSNDEIKLNVEFLTPLESGAKRLGKRIDTKYDYENTFISNQLLPLPIEVSMSRRLEIEDTIGGATSAGGILHLNCEGELPFENTLELIKKIVTLYPNIEHFAINKTMSYCEDGHLTLKNTDICELCGKPIMEKISRSIGYFRAIKSFSDARQKEFTERKWHETPKQYKFIEGDEN